VRTSVQIFDRGAERKTDEMMTRRIEEVPAMGGVDIEEDTRNDNSLFLQELLKESLK
jgi:hypothetical protein